VSDIVYNANGSDVTHVWVDGELVVDDGRLTTVDEAEAIRECQKIADTVWERGKYLFGDEMAEEERA
jgi:5-methylthioadenosine/S-adenosylhomocysteine deaminase